MQNFYPNYYNPQYAPQQFQQYATPMQTGGINGRLVNDFNEIQIKDIPTDCTPAFFIKSDYSEIQSRRWSDTGNVIPMTYKAVNQASEPKTDPFEVINRRLDSIEELLTKKPTTRKKEENET